MRWTAPTVVVLAMCLSGCASASKLTEAEKARPVATAAELARICPTPTDRARLAAIVDYLARAEPDPGLDALASEYERLLEGSEECRKPGENSPG